MSLAIDIDTVASVKISGEWFTVLRGDDGFSTFAIDAYEYLGSYYRTECGERLYQNPDSAGCCFDAEQGCIIAPMEAVEAVIISPELVKKKSTVMAKRYKECGR